MNVVTIITGLVQPVFFPNNICNLYIISLIYYELNYGLIFVYCTCMLYLYVFSYDEYKTFTGCVMIADIGGSTVGN